MHLCRVGCMTPVRHCAPYTSQGLLVAHALSFRWYSTNPGLGQLERVKGVEPRKDFMCRALYSAAVKISIPMPVAAHGSC